MEVRRKIEGVLDNNLLPHFTDHSISHCDRIADITRRLIEETAESGNSGLLSKYELFVLALAILLHDVGMQIPKAHGIETPVNELSADEFIEIRRDHGEVSGGIVKELADGRDDFLHLGLEESNVKRYLPVVATICKSHQSLAQYDPRQVVRLGSQSFRVGLLTALLRLADQLDCDWRRVDLGKLDHFSIPLDSVLHWLASSYVDAVSIEAGFIRVEASFPETMAGPEVEFLCRLLIDKLWNEYGPSEEVLWQNGMRLRLPRSVAGTGTDFRCKKESLPVEILEEIRDEFSQEAPSHVTIEPQERVPGEETDWMSHWRFVGNPFLDRPVAYGMERFVETTSLRQMMNEAGSYLEGEGELKLLVGARGMGKTTLFKSVKSRFSESYDTLIIDVADSVVDVHNVADLHKLIFFRMQREMSSEEPTGTTDDLVDAARLGRKKAICVDSLDRLPEEQDELVRDFFKTAQHTLSRMRTVALLVFACADRWTRFLSSDELSYLGYRNQWKLSPFASGDIVEMIDRRLKASGQSFSQVFEPSCAAILSTLSDGNPRLVLEHAQAICRLGAQKKQERITSRFISKEYEKEFDQALKKLLTRLVDSSAACKKAMTSIYHYYLEMERRGMDTSEGWNQLIELVETGLKPNRVRGPYRMLLGYVSETSRGLSARPDDSRTLVPFPFIRTLFKTLKKEGFSTRDFLTFYSAHPVAPREVDDDLEARLKDQRLVGPEFEYFEKARRLYIETRRSTGPPFQVISNAWDCVEHAIFAILIKRSHPDVSRMIARQEEWFVEDKYGVPRYVRGAGQLRAEHASELVQIFKDWLYENRLWMSSLVSLRWIQHARANVVRGKTEYLMDYGDRERDLCLRHLDSVYKELSRLFG